MTAHALAMAAAPPAHLRGQGQAPAATSAHRADAGQPDMERVAADPDMSDDRQARSARRGGLEGELPPVDAAEVPIRTPPQSSTATHMFADAQSMELIGQPSIASSVHALAPPVGFVVTATFPARSPATHSEVVGHVTVLSPLGVAFGASIVATALQAFAAGSVDVNAPPALSTATHCVLPAHETAFADVVSGLLVLQAVAPPVGFVELSVLPAESTATQSVAVGHEIASSALPSSMSASFQAAAPPVGSVEVSTSPVSSTATHSAVVGHETDTTAL